MVRLPFRSYGSEKRQTRQTIEREGQPPVSYTDDNDREMVMAMEKAQSTVVQFIAALNSPKAAQRSFSVKAPVKDGNRLEHVWILPVRYEEGRFRGIINNEPNNVTTVKIGE